MSNSPQPTIGEAIAKPTTDVMYCMLAGVSCVGILVFVAVVLKGNWPGWVFFPLLFFTGTLGASINNYRRLLTLGVADGKLRTLEVVGGELPTQLMTLQIWLSAVIGGFFGIVIYMIFVSELLSGELFPEFKILPPKSESGMSQLISATYLASSKDAAKAIVWSFVAGFSEEFVPNLLKKLSKAAEGEVQKATERVAAQPPKGDVVNPPG